MSASTRSPSRALPSILSSLVLLCAACGETAQNSTPGASGASGSNMSKATGKLTLLVDYGSEKKTWMEEMVTRFEASGPKTSSGKAILVEAVAMGSGESTAAILSGQRKPHVFSPASGAYIALLNEAWLSQAGNTKALSPQGDSLILSPIVIAIWKPMAEALGWPAKPIGWADLIQINNDPTGWGALSHPEWGRFKLGHTHPGLSNSGLLAVLAEAYAGAKKTRDLSVADLEAKETLDFLTKVEGALVHYGKSTGFFADKMLERGPEYLSAAVLYENLVIESYSKSTSAPFPIVAIYPVEGTFWSDHPYAILDAPWVGAEEREAAEIFLRFLQGEPQQERALALGFRPADASIAIGAPIDAAHGVDPKQPQTLLAVPDGPTLVKLLEAWEKTKKAAYVTLVFDKSGSMAGAALTEAKTGAKAFLKSLSDRDEVSLLFFDNNVYPATPLKKLEGGGREELITRVDGTVAMGGTALYDATWAAYEEAQKRAILEPSRIHAVVVMTDGKDEHSKKKLEELKKKLSSAEELTSVKIFTIAYGPKADPAVLADIAEAAQGTSAVGSIETIQETFREMAAFF